MVHRHHPLPERRPAPAPSAPKAPPHRHDHAAHHAGMAEDFKWRFVACLALTLPILALSPMIQRALGLADRLAFPGDTWVLLGLSVLIYAYGGWPFLRGAAAELRRGQPGMMTLVALAITVAFGYSVAVVLGLEGTLFFWEAATLIDVMLLGHWVEMRSVLGASKALDTLATLMPETAHQLGPDGMTADVSVASLRAGDRIQVKASETIPVDGRVVEGASSVDESLVTGESVPVEKGEGDPVVAGSKNGSGSLVVAVEKTGEDAYVGQVVRLVRDAQTTKSRAQTLADKAAFGLTLVALGTAAVTFLGWSLGSAQTLTFAVERAVTVLVIACPHALGLAIPLVVAVSTALGVKKGLLVRNRAAFETARKLDTVVFDKTGTLTEGRFGVTDILAPTAIPTEAVLRLAAAVEGGSEHPLAAGVLRTAEERDLAVPRVTDFHALPGRGVEGTVDGHAVRILSPGAARDAGLQAPFEAVAPLEAQGKTVVWVARGRQAVGALALADTVRPTSKAAVAALHAMGMQVILLTGDREAVAEHVAARLGIDRVFAEVRPEEKEGLIRSLQSEGRVVAMTGDGVNDAPALARADVGLAVGAGTDVAVDTADVVLVDSDPRAVAQAIRLARATYRKMIQNLWYAVGYNVVALPLAAGALAWAGVVLSPAVGAALMSLSTVVVAANARRLKLDA